MPYSLHTQRAMRQQSIDDMICRRKARQTYYRIARAHNIDITTCRRIINDELVRLGIHIPKHQKASSSLHPFFD